MVSIGHNQMNERPPGDLMTSPTDGPGLFSRHSLDYVINNAQYLIVISKLLEVGRKVMSHHYELLKHTMISTRSYVGIRRATRSPASILSKHLHHGIFTSI